MLYVDWIQDEEEMPVEKPAAKLPLHKDPEYLAALKRAFIEQHNARIRKQKAGSYQLPARAKAL
ncbi:hypothetical protein FW774_06060 [Pedobacter sp. BS3]|uniref:hypothetical protein n=1 Tax=Pedobacter sp. BS3 TaxID=2567937 RepID=UPI0011F02F1B|nr:hypothetical protein [Pedobacter sp. BS3]TZF84549.1 hypothetical protein FW774_06060 [Pedobacter sp. BS3]